MKTDCAAGAADAFSEDGVARVSLKALGLAPPLWVWMCLMVAYLVGMGALFVYMPDRDASVQWVIALAVVMAVGGFFSAQFFPVWNCPLNGVLRWARPDVRRVLAYMTSAVHLPDPSRANPGRSGLVVLARLSAPKQVSLYQKLACYDFVQGTWVDASSGEVVEMRVTHWMDASEQDRLFV